MKLARVCLLALCLTINLWSDSSEDILDYWKNVEKSFSGIKYLGLRVVDKYEDAELVDRIQQVIFTTFEKYNQPLASKEEYDLQDAELGIFLNRDQGVITGTILLQILIEEELEFFYVDCFSIEQENIVERIEHKVNEIINDMIQGKGSFKLFIAE